MAENAQSLSVNSKMILWMVPTNTCNSKLWKLTVLKDKGNCKNIIYQKPHLIKNNQVLATEKLIPKNCTIYLFFWKMNFLQPKNIFPTFSQIYRLNGKTFISYHVKFQLTPIYVCSNITYWIVFYILMSSFMFLIKRILNCFLTVDYKMKQLNCVPTVDYKMKQLITFL